MGRAYSMVFASVSWRRWRKKGSRVGRRRPFRRQRQHGDRLAEAGRNHRQRRAWPDRRSQAEEDRRPHRDWLVGRCGSGTSPCAGSWLSCERGLKVDYR